MLQSTSACLFTQTNNIMKRIVFVLALVLLTCGVNAQTLKAGTDGYVTVNGQNYPRGYLLSVYNYEGADSTLAILFATNRTILIKPTNNASYKYVDSANAPARNMLVLRNWMNANFENK